MSNKQKSEIHSTTTIWLSGKNRRPTTFLPNDLAQKFGMDRPCRIAVIESQDGILLKFLHLNNNGRNHKTNGNGNGNNNHQY